MKKQTLIIFTIVALLLLNSCASGGGEALTDVPDLGTATIVSVEGTQLIVNGEPFHIKGVCWNPIGKGGRHPNNIDFIGYAQKDVKLMAEAGINTVRTYEPITNTKVLDILYENGIYVINGVFASNGQSDNSVINAVQKTKNHPAILMWALGNEWNYNKLYSNLPFIDVMERIYNLTESIKAVDANHPITSVYGVWGADLPASEVVDFLDGIDIWGINMYAGLGFETLFETWASRYNKPIFLSEYGADAWNADKNSKDLESQAFAVSTLTKILLDNSSKDNPESVVTGGTVFEWADEWWKDPKGSAAIHDKGGSAPGGGPYPDSVFNEEFWGIVDIDRNPRPAYTELQKLYIPVN